MARIRDIYDIIDAVAPFSTALELRQRRPAGGRRQHRIVTRALLALDITPAVVAEAASMNANLILSHHPAIFPPRQVPGPPGRALPAGQPGHCGPVLPHQFGPVSRCAGSTWPWAASWGCGTSAGRTCSGRTACSFPGTWRSPWSRWPSPPLVKGEALRPGGEVLPGGAARCSGCSSAAAPAGSTSSLAACRGADAYLTGEMKHHEELEAAQSRLTCVAAGHYHTEKVFGEFLASYLRKRVPDTAFLLSQAEAAPMGAL